jgi:hypothetical protein
MSSNIAQTPAPPAVSFFNPDNGMALARPTEVVAPSGIAQDFAKFIHMAEVYAYSHVNMPSTHKDNAMPQEVKQRLMNAASTTSAFQLMQTPFTRYQLVTKLILQYCFRVILRHDTFAGFDPEIDQIIESCRNQIYQCKSLTISAHEQSN